MSAFARNFKLRTESYLESASLCLYIASFLQQTIIRMRFAHSYGLNKENNLQNLSTFAPMTFILTLHSFELTVNGQPQKRARQRTTQIQVRGSNPDKHLSCSSHERTMYRASGVKFFLCGHGKCRRDLSAEHSMRISVGYGGPAAVARR